MSKPKCCHRCGRWGNRGYVWDSEAEANRCSNDRTCEARRAKAGRVTYSATGAMGEYAVTFAGRRLCTVRSRETHYNLRRAVTVHWWQVEGVEGFDREAVEYRDRIRKFDTRTEAVAAVIEHLGLEGVRP